MKKSTLLGLLAVGCTLSYLFLKKREGDASIDGVEIKINPEKLIDGALAISSINPTTKEGLRNMAHTALQKYYESYE